MRALALVLCLTLGLSSAAQAQALPAWLLVPRNVVASSELGAPLGTSIHPLSKQARRATFMIAAGAGLVAAGVVHAAMFGGSVCYERETRIGRPIPAGSTVAAVGLALTLAGAIRLSRVPSEQRLDRAVDRAYLPLTAFGTALLASGGLFAFTAPEFYGCISS